jgi:capsular exopolysaccharide synthesis family protein
MTAGAILQALRRRWFVALCSALLLAAATATVLWFVLQPSSNVRSLLLVATVQPRIMPGTAADGGGREDFANYLKTQAALVKSRLVLNAALRDEKIKSLSVVAEQPDQLEWLEKELEVDNTVAPEILRVTMNGDRPDERAKLLDSIVDAYRKEIVNKERDRRRERQGLLETELQRYQKELINKRTGYKTLAESAGSGEAQTLQLAHKFALEQLNMAQTELLKCRSEIRQLEAAINIAPLQPLPAQAPIDEGVFRDDYIKGVQQQMALLRQKLDQLKERAKNPESQPLYKRLKEQLDTSEKDIASHRKELAKLYGEEQQAKAKGEVQLAADKQRRHIAILKGLEKTLDDEVKKHTDAAKDINRFSLDIAAIKDEITHMEAMANRIAIEKESIKVETEAPSRVTLLEPAVASRTKAERRRYMGVGIGTAAALALALFGVTWLELRARRITNSEDIVQGLGVRIVGTIPYVADQSASQRTGESQNLPAPYGQQLLTESIDATRTMLLHAAQLDSLKIVMIASAVGGEGKTSLASHLAVSLAHAGRRTLLVDTDLRKPAVHQVFDVPVAPGLSDVLRGSAPLLETIRPSDIDGLSLLPAGEACGQTLRALAQKGLTPIFEQLREQYDIIVVDSCPVLPVADALVVAQHVDAVIFSILREVSRFPTVHAAWERLESLGVRMLGAVVNGAREHHHGYSYYYSR